MLAALIAAVCHDLDHPGVNQPFLIATDNHLAALYKVMTRGGVGQGVLMLVCHYDVTGRQGSVFWLRVS